MKYGVDISKHQQSDTVDRLSLGGKAEFVITRSTVGTYTVDSKLERFMADIKKHGYKNSHYHAAYAGTVAEAIEEANFCCDTIEKFSDKVEMPIFYDWEYFSADYNKGRGIVCDKALIQAMTVAFCERVKERGYTAGVYSNKDFCDRYYTPDFWAAHTDYAFWYARPGLNKPDKPCYIWQYASDNGSEYGYPFAIDKNILYGEFMGNGGNIPPFETMKPLSKDPCKMRIGFASEGDIKKLVTKVEGLGISAQVTGGYIVTGLASSGDQCYIMADCEALGVGYEIYKGDEGKPIEPPIEEGKPTEPDGNIGGSLIWRILKRIWTIFFGGGSGG